MSVNNDVQDVSGDGAVGTFQRHVLGWSLQTPIFSYISVIIKTAVNASRILVVVVPLYSNGGEY